MSGYAGALAAWVPPYWDRILDSFQNGSAAAAGLGIGVVALGVFTGLRKAYEGVGQRALKEWSARLLSYVSPDTLEDVVTDIMDRLEKGTLDSHYVGEERAQQAAALSEDIARRLRVVSMNFSGPAVPAGVTPLVHRLVPDLLATQNLSRREQENCFDGLQKHYSLLDLPGGPVLYRHSRLDLIKHGVRHLMIEGQRYSLPVVIFKDKASETVVVHLNVSLHFRNLERRQQEAKEISNIVASLPKGVSVILTGALNTFPARMDLDLPGYDGPEVMKSLEKAFLVDSRAKAVMGHLGPDETTKAYELPPMTLDRILVNDYVEVFAQAHETATFNGKPPLQHLPVVADVLLLGSDGDSSDGQQGLDEMLGGGFI